MQNNDHLNNSQTKDQASISAIDNIMKSATFENYIKETFIKNNIAGRIPILKATIFNFSFWQFVFDNFSNIWQLRNTYKDLLNKDSLRNQVLDLDSFQKLQNSVFVRLDARQQQNLKDGIIAISKLPKKDSQALIDETFISAVIELLNLNDENLKIFQQILKISLKKQSQDRILDPADSMFGFSKSEIIDIIQNLKRAQGIDKLIHVKRGVISAKITDFLSKDIKGLVDEQKIIDALANFESEDDIRMLLDIADAGFSGNYTQLTSKITTMLADDKYQNVKDLLKDPDVLCSFCFDKTQSIDGELIFSLSAIGRKLITQDKNGKDLEPNFTITLNLPLEAKIKELLEETEYNNVKLNNGLEDQDFLKVRGVSQSGEIVYELSDKAKTLNLKDNNGQYLEPNITITFKPELGQKIKELLGEKQYNKVKWNNSLKDQDFLKVTGVSQSGEIVYELSDKAKTLNLKDNNGNYLEPHIIVCSPETFGHENQNNKEEFQNIVVKEFNTTLLDIVPNALELGLHKDILTSLQQNLAIGNLQNGVMLGDKISGLSDRDEIDNISKKLYSEFFNSEQLNELDLAKLLIALEKKKKELDAIGKKLPREDLKAIFIENISKKSQDGGKENLRRMLELIGNETQANLKIDWVIKTIKNQWQFKGLEKISIQNNSELEAVKPNSKINIAANTLYNNFKTTLQDINLRGQIIEKLANLENLNDLNGIEQALQDGLNNQLTEDNILCINNAFKSAEQEVGGEISVLCKRLKHEHQIFNLQEKLKNVNADALFLLSTKVDKDKYWNKDSIAKLIDDFSPIPKDIAQDFMNGGQTISSEELKYLISDVALRQKAIEDFITMQKMLKRVFAPFIALMTSANIKDADLSKTLFNKLLKSMNQDFSMIKAIQHCILKKGDQESTADVIVEASKEIFCSDKYSDANQKLLADKIIKPMINQIISNTFVKNAITTVIDQAKIKENANRLFVANSQIKATLTNILKGDLRAITGSAQVLPLINFDTLSIGIRLGRGNTVNNDQKIADKFGKDLADAREKIQHSGKVDVQALLNKNFSDYGLHTLAGKDLSGYDLSKSKFEDLIFEQTTFSNANLTNSEFYNCSFNNCIINNINLSGAQFDLASFKTFITNAENQKLDIDELLMPVVVKSNVIKDPVNAQLMYGLMQYAKVCGIEFNDQLIDQAFKNNIEFEDLKYLKDKNLKLIKIALSDNDLQLSEIKALPQKLVGQYITEEMLKYSPTDHLNDLKQKSMSEILSRWYLNRATDKMKPTDPRNVDGSPKNCLNKAINYSRQSSEQSKDDDHKLASDIAQATILKLFGDRYLSEPDRLDDAEKIYNATLKLVTALDQDSKDILQNNNVNNNVLNNVAEDLAAALKPKTQREIKAIIFGRVYLPNTLTTESIEGFLGDKLSNENIKIKKTSYEKANLIDAIIKKEKSLKNYKDELSLENYRGELEKLELEVLGVIDDNPLKFAERSKVKVIPGFLPGFFMDRRDTTLHDAMYALDAKALQQLLAVDEKKFQLIANAVECIGKDRDRVIKILQSCFKDYNNEILHNDDAYDSDACASTAEEEPQKPLSFLEACINKGQKIARDLSENDTNKERIKNLSEIAAITILAHVSIIEDEKAQSMPAIKAMITKHYGGNIMPKFDDKAKNFIKNLEKERGSPIKTSMLNI
jgi:uncharacterized protein YjbI with pentapeptide repeats